MNLIMNFVIYWKRRDWFIAGLSPDGKLVEVCELANHPWMVGCQFHPEFGSRPNRPHPLFLGFIEVARNTLREGSSTFFAPFIIE